jgi:acetolactate synthase I/II/III large subunit
MNGAESLVHSLLASGVDTCFANPGTSEMHFVAALDRIPGMRCVLGLFEGVVSGAADGYARMSDRPAATLLHCGPGMANAMANLHNAQKARVPMINIVGDQATYHRPLNAPLTAATEVWAEPFSVWTRSVSDPAQVGASAAEAVRAARTAPGGIATLILPSDASWTEGGVVAPALNVPAAAGVSEAALIEAARLIKAGGAALLLDGLGLREEGLAIAHRIRAATGCRLLAQTFAARVQRGPGRALVERIPYVVDAAHAALKDVASLVMVGTERPATFFAYPGKSGTPEPESAIRHTLAAPGEDVIDALARLADMLGASQVGVPDAPERPEIVKGAPTSAGFARTLSAVMPEEAVIVDESISFGFAFQPNTVGAPRNDWLQLTGGAIGIGLPLATGAAMGAPGRRVIALQADGSALYTVQALWTQAREQLDVTNVIFSNRAYAILKAEFAGVGAVPGETALGMMQLANPTIDWLKLSESFGVEAARAETLEEFADLLVSSSKRKGPFLIELVIA